jgi:hypothetical protein
MPTVTVDQAKLVMNAFAATFQNNLSAKDVVTWRKYDSEMDDRNGLKVVEQVGPRYRVTRTTSGVQDLSAGTQDSVFGSEQFVVQDVFGTSMGWGDFVKIRDIGAARESEALKAAAMQLAEQIDAYVLRQAVLTPNNHLGTAGTAISTLNHISRGYTRLKEEGVEDGGMRAVLSYSDREALADTLVAYPATDSLSTGAFRNGFAGEIAGIPTVFTQQLPTMTNGTRTNGTVAGANQNVNYSAVAISGAPGQYLTQTINLAGLGAGGTVKDGEVFTIANVNAWDNRLGASHARLQQFRVVGDATADGTGAATVRIFPAIIIGNNDVNIAHRTVDAAPANGAVVTFLGAASAAYKPRAILDKNSVIVNTADLILPSSDTAVRKQLTKVPLSVRMWQASDFNTGRHDVRFDVALTANTRDRRRGVRINGG